jgi:hypothetical protein
MWGMPAHNVDVARLLVTELASNAVRHGSGAVLLGVSREGEGVVVGLYDENPDPPVVVEVRVAGASYPFGWWGAPADTLTGETGVDGGYDERYPPGPELR